jgi:hypothetical protein
MALRLSAALLAATVVGVIALGQAGTAAAQPTGELLTGIPVTGTLADGGTFEGVLSITGFAIDDGQLLASGVLEGTATQDGVVTEVTQTFTNIPVGLIGDGDAGACDILFLDLGPIDLDLLGLTVDLSQIVLDVNAVPGAGNLLGNLLCAVVGLLDGPGSGNGLTALINRINNLLG